MLVTVFCAPRDRPETTFALDVSPELELRDFVALCELESGIPAGEIQARPMLHLATELTKLAAKLASWVARMNRTFAVLMDEVLRNLRCYPQQTRFQNYVSHV